MNPSELIDKQIADLADWRGGVVKKLRQLIHEADPEIAEEWKWGTGVWTHNGLVCAIGVFKDHVKINFFRGVLLKDPHGLLNAGLDSKSHRSVNFQASDPIQENSLKDLIREAVAQNDA